MPNFNKTILAGHLTRDIEIKYSANDLAVGKTGIAVNSKYKDKENTLFIDLTIFGKQAGNSEKYVGKGSAVLVEGTLQLEQWNTSDGDKRSKHSIIVNSIVFLGKSEKPTSEPDDSEDDIF